MEDILWVFHVRWYDVVDILLVTALLYFVFTLAMGTQAVQLLRGMVLVIVVLFLVSRALPFKGVRLAGGQCAARAPHCHPCGVSAGNPQGPGAAWANGGLLGKRQREETVEKVISEIVRAAHRLAADRHGALIVLERDWPSRCRRDGRLGGL